MSLKSSVVFGLKRKDTRELIFNFLINICYLLSTISFHGKELHVKGSFEAGVLPNIFKYVLKT